MHLIELLHAYVPGFPWLMTVLGENGIKYLIYAQAFLYFAIVFWMTHRLFRRLSRQTYYDGRWWPRAEYAEMMQILAEDQAIRGRVLNHEEKIALRRWQYGDSLKPVFRDKKYGGYFG